VPYGQGWRKLRKACQSLLNVNEVDSLLPIQNAEASQTMFELLQSPGDCYNHIRRYSTAVILASVFGQRGAKFESPKVQALYHAQDQFTEILAPGATPPIDAFPFLKFLPAFISGWRARAKRVRQEQSSLYLELLQETKDRISHNKTTPCFLEKVLVEQEKSGLDDEHVAYLGGNLVRRMSNNSCVVGPSTDAPRVRDL
jgi:cytochrome P450